MFETKLVTRKNILIVEDDIVFVFLLANKLKLAGFDVTSASDGQKAAEVLSKETFDLILLDLMMPWFDGFHLLEYLKEKNIKTPVIILSNLADVDDINRAKSLGAVDYLVKTATTPELVTREVEKYVKK